MATYLMLLRFTRQGIQNIRELPARIEALREDFKKAKAEIKTCYGLLGQYDTVFLVEAPDDVTIARLAMHVGKAGDMTCESHRAFDEEEYRRICAAV